MKRIYQRTGSRTGEEGDCFAACLGSLLGVPLNFVPNFMSGTGNGKLLPDSSVQIMTTWLKGRGCGGYVEFGFNLLLERVLENIGNSSPEAYYILTGCNEAMRTHAVVCRGGLILHDPATSPGIHNIRRPCRDGFYRVGFLLFPT